VAANAFTTTMTASAASLLTWLLYEQVTDGRPTTLGAASGAIAGLVAITPACGFVDTFGALVIGGLAGVVCALAIKLKYRLGYDDSLDVLALHGVGGLTGTVMIGLFASKAVNSAGANGLLYGGGLDQLWRQAVAALVAMVYAFGVTFLLARLVSAMIGFRIAPEIEIAGIDEAEHAESAYDLSLLGSSGRAGVGAGTSGLHTGSAAREEF
jgi:Amt family ammonium transporter